MKYFTYADWKDHNTSKLPSVGSGDKGVPFVTNAVKHRVNCFMY